MKPIMRKKVFSKTETGNGYEVFVMKLDCGHELPQLVKVSDFEQTADEIKIRCITCEERMEATKQ